MRANLTQFGTAAAIVVLLASPSFAQNTTRPADQAPAPGNTATHTMGTNDAGKGDDVRVSKLVGATVYNDQNQSVGSVDDILLSHNSKQPVDAIISVGGFLGIGSKLVEVDYDRLKLEDNNKVVMPNASRDELKGMQSFSYNTLEHGGTTNASSNTGAPGAPYNGPSTATSTGTAMGTSSSVGTTTTTTPNGTTHTTTTTPDGTTHSSTTR